MTSMRLRRLPTLRRSQQEMILTHKGASSSSFWQKLITSTEVPVFFAGDIIHFEDKIRPIALHWTRERDLTYVLQGSNEGLEA
mmetsp:Transcript_74633/g.129516  ORF Transcript_74633/g.129516 Transcript_74633/m.129516 type:complete len:83 (+) Transcript_74633:1570-1818(+)